MPLPATSRVLVQLVAPGAGGVRDFAEGLRLSWQGHGSPTQVLELSQADARQSALADRLRRVTSAAGAAGAPMTLLVHFSGYGYHPRGLCGWLVSAVQAARQAWGTDLRVVTYFHELFATGPPWRSAFWLAGAQAHIARRLAQASDALWTNSSHHALWLRGQVGAGMPIQVQPVFSTVGEPEHVPAFAARRRQLVVFGSASTRARALQGLPRHARLLRAAGIEELLEVGSGAAGQWSDPALRHRHLGRMDEPALRELLQDSAYSLIDYPSVHLAKSTVYACYAVHGCVVLNTAEPGPDADGLAAGLHYQTLGQPPTRWQHQPQQMVDAARAWYAPHCLPRQALAQATWCGLALPKNAAPDP